MHTPLFRTLLGLAAVATLGIGVVSPARGALPEGQQLTPAGPGGALARYGTSTQLHCHAARRSSPREGVFFGETACGTFVVTSQGLFVPDDIPGGHVMDDVSTAFTPVLQRTEPVPGSPGATRIVSVVDAGEIRVTQVDQHRPGTGRVGTTTVLTNRGRTTRWALLFRAADCYSDGRDEGFGAIRAQVSAACVSSDDGQIIRLSTGADGLRPSGVWEGTYQDMWQRITEFVDGRQGAHPGFNNTCRCREEVDNAVGLQWSVSLPPGESATFQSELDIGSTMARGRTGGDAPLPTGGRPIVALGDSYSSGEGAGEQRQRDDFDYYPGTDTRSNRCHRSANAYPVLVSQALGADPGQALDFRACSGAVIADVRGPGRRHGEAPQMEALGADTALATLTIGGNDAGFVPVITACYSPHVLRGCDVTKRVAVSDALKRLESPGEAGLGSLYRTLRRRVGSSARTVVLGYPDFVPGDDDRCMVRGLLDGDERTFLRTSVRRLNRLVQRRARWAGWDFVDVSAPYDAVTSPHRACARDEWVNGPIRAGVSPRNESFHPNRLGHRAMASQATSTIRTTKREMTVRQAQHHELASRTTLVVPPGRAVEMTATVNERLITVVSMDHGDGLLDVALRDAAGKPVPTRRMVDDGSEPPSGATIIRMGDVTVVHLRGLPPGTYVVSWSLAAGEIDPVLAVATTSTLPDENTPPSAIVTGRVLRDGSVELDSRASGDADQLLATLPTRWEFGDGTAGRGPKVRHRYPRRARYIAVATVTDNQGATARSAQIVDLTGSPFITIRATRATRGVRFDVRCLSQADEVCQALLSVTFTDRAGRRLARVQHPLGLRPGERARPLLRAPAVASQARRAVVLARAVDQAVRRNPVLTVQARIALK